MTRSIRSLFSFFALFVFVTLLVVPALAQSTDPVPAATTASATITSQNLVVWLTPVIVPLLIAGVKLVLPKIPSWVLPVIAPVLGVLVSVLNGLATSHSSNLVVAALLGLAGVGVREVKDQFFPATPAETKLP